MTGKTHSRSFISVRDWDCIKIEKSENKEVFVKALFLLSTLGAEVKQFSQLISVVRAYLITVRVFSYIVEHTFDVSVSKTCN